MGRRSTKHTIDLHCYKDFIAAVKKDLKITDCVISIQERNYTTFMGQWWGANGYYLITLTLHRGICETACTLLHELRHIWQQEKGKHVIIGDKVYWRGKEHRSKSAVNYRKDIDAYNKLPWELDATKFENTLGTYIHLICDRDGKAIYPKE